MEGSLQNQQRIIQTYSDVFWNVQFSSHFSIDDGCYLCQYDWWLYCHYLYGWHFHIHTRWNNLMENTKKVLTRLQENNLFLKPTKCETNQTKVEYLGMVIEEGKISMDPGKLSGIWDWPEPTTVKQVQGFLGFKNFYWRFIWNFSEKAKPLNDLLKIWMDKWLPRSIWQPKEMVHQGTSCYDSFSSC